MIKIKKYIATTVTLIVFIFGLYVYFILGNQARSHRGEAQGGEYVTKMYGDYQVIGKSCQGEDSDNNGYITCNFRLKQSTTNVEKTIILQCPTFVKSFMATNCKEQGIVINQQ